jgi:hypothetical protein
MLLPQVLLWLKLEAFAPFMVTLDTLKLALPVLLTVTVWVALVDSAGVEKEREGMLNEIIGPITVPVRVTVCVELAALSLKLSTAL